MTEERRIQIVAEVDATRARTGLNEIGREAGAMAAAVAERSRVAENAIAGIGGGAGRSAAQVEAAGRNLINTIQRQTAALEAGARGSSTYFESMARQRGIPLSTIEPLLAGLRQQEDLQRRAAAATEAGAAAQRSAAESARAQAAAQRELAQAQAAGQNFLNGLREQIQLFGRSADEILKYRAAQAGVAGAAAPLILQLQNQRAAHDAVTAAARQQTLAEQQAAQVQGRRDSFLTSLEQQAAAIGKTRSQLLELQAAQMGVTTQAAPFIARLREAEVGVARAGVSAGQTANALRQLPAQFTDIVTSLQGGQKPLTVLLQQGGQIKDSFGGAGAAAVALGGYILKMVNPYTVAAAAAAGLAYAYHEGAIEATAYRKAIILSGNAAGTSADQLAGMARVVSQSVGTQGAAAEALNAMVATGKVSSANLAQFSTIAIKAQRALGQSVGDTATQFAELAQTPSASLLKLNEQYHFLTGSVYQQVRALEMQGRTYEAGQVAQQAFANGFDSVTSKVTANLGLIEKALLTGKDAWKEFYDGALNIGRQRSLEDQLEVVQQRLKVNPSGALPNGLTAGAPGRNAIYAAQRAADLLQEQSLKAQIDDRDLIAAQEAQSIRQKAAGLEWSKTMEQSLTRQKQYELELQSVENKGRAANASDEQINTAKLAVRRKYSDVVNKGVDSNIEALKRRQGVEDALTQRIIARINATKGLGATGEEEAIRAIAKAEDDQFEQRIENLKKQKADLKDKQDSTKEQLALQGQIDVLEVDRGTRRLQLGYDLQQQTRGSLSLYADQLDQLRSSRDAAIQQIQGQKDYNEEIGKTATELLFLRQARVEEMAVRLDARARAADAEDLTGDKAAAIRAEAAAIRERLAEERIGFVKQRDPYANLFASVKRYGDEASNVGAQIGDAMTNGFRSAEDALVSFTTSGKLNFGSFATSIIGDLARIQARQAISGLASLALESFFGGISNAQVEASHTTEMGRILGQLPARANGGPVTSGTSYLVGERGPEVFTPSSTGRIIANHALGSIGGGDAQPIIQTTININDGQATTSSTGGSAEQARALAGLINAEVKDVLAKEQRQGGILWNMKQGRA